MRSLCIFALLLLAVAARPDEDGVGASGGEGPERPEGSEGTDWESGRPVWPQERPSRGPGGSPPMGGAGGSGCQPERPSQLPHRGKRAAPAAPAGRRPSSARPRRHPGRGRRPHKGHPGGRPTLDQVDFSRIFKVDNVTFQNTTDVLLKEGENVFLLPERGGRRHHHHKGGKHEPPKIQFVKLLYSSTEPDTVSIEYGLLKHNPGELFVEEDNPDGR